MDPMFPGSSPPTTIGGTISTATSATLAAMSANGLPIGTEVWNADVGANFKLTISTAALVTDEVVAVKDTVGSRWIIVEASGGTVITDGVTLDGDGSIGDPLTANPIFAFDWRMDLLRRCAALVPAAGFNEVQASNCNSMSLGDDVSKQGIELEVGVKFDLGDVVLEATNGGSLLVSSGATNGGTRVMQFRGEISSTVPAKFVSNLRTQPWAVYALAQAVAGPTVAGDIIRMANMWATVDSNFGWDGAVAANWSMKIGAASPLDLGVAADLNLHHFLMVNDVTNVKAYLDWTQIGSAVSSAGLATGPGFPRSYDETASSANVSHRMLRFAIVYAKPTPA